jgi:hypothetical protein
MDEASRGRNYTLRISAGGSALCKISPAVHENETRGSLLKLLLVLASRRVSEYTLQPSVTTVSRLWKLDKTERDKACLYITYIPNLCGAFYILSGVITVSLCPKNMATYFKTVLPVRIYRT